nr:hypothetical protein [Vampirovibrio sp.]
LLLAALGGLAYYAGTKNSDDSPVDAAALSVGFGSGDGEVVNYGVTNPRDGSFLNLPKWKPYGPDAGVEPPAV